ncbi:hypothetical protein WJ972_34135 [Achromobacter insuavis]
MNKKHVSENAGGTPWAWGWEQPQCRGQAALALFIDDLHRILQNYTAGRLAASATLADAQEQVDQLLARYNEIAAAPKSSWANRSSSRKASTAAAFLTPYPFFPRA